jgi:hypothetical protein
VYQHKSKNPKKIFSEVETLVFVINDFLQYDAEEKILTSPLKAHGYSWRLAIGFGVYNAVVALVHDNTIQDHSPSANVSLRCSNGGSKSFIHHDYTNKEKNDIPGIVLNIHRNNVPTNGTVTIEANIQVEKKGTYCPKEIVSDPFLSKLIESPRTADITFLADGQEFYLHRNVLAINGNGLYEFYAKHNANNCNTPAIIGNVDKHTFKSIVNYIYQVNTPTIKDIDCGKSLLVASDRFNLVNLKLYAEAVIVDQFLTGKNAADLFLFADSYSCALLREESMGWSIKDPRAFQAGETWTMILESKDILVELYRYSLTRNGYDHGTRYDDDVRTPAVETMDVNSLRFLAEKNNLEVDGTREALVTRLKAVLNEEYRLSRATHMISLS